MTVAEPTEAAWGELLSTLETSCNGAAPCDCDWEAKVREGQPMLRIFMGRRWWEIRLRSTVWSRAKKAAYEKVASGAARAELFFSRGSFGASGPIACRIVAWLPRECVEDAPGRTDAGPRHIEKMSLGKLREAIGANRVSFPSPIPAFPTRDRLDLQPKLAELYFVWRRDIEAIGAECGLSFWQVRDILNAWKHEAASAEYIRHIPSAEAMGQPTTSPALLDDTHPRWRSQILLGRPFRAARLGRKEHSSRIDRKAHRDVVRMGPILRIHDPERADIDARLQATRVNLNRDLGRSTGRVEAGFQPRRIRRYPYR